MTYAIPFKNMSANELQNCLWSGTGPDISAAVPHGNGMIYKFHVILIPTVAQIHNMHTAAT